jgi:hypothetical protein
VITIKHPATLDGNSRLFRKKPAKRKSEPKGKANQKEKLKPIPELEGPLLKK